MKVTTDSVLFGSWVPTGGVSTILDIGAGSGLLSLMLAQRSSAQITAIEPDSGSFDDLSFNVSHSPWKGRINVLQTSLDQFVQKQQGRFDLIICNPPFFDDGVLPAPGPVREARHTTTLNHNDLVKTVPGLLGDQGRFCVMIPESYAEGLIYKAFLSGLYCNKWADLVPEVGQPVIERFLEFSGKKEILQKETIPIKLGKDYSPDFIRLMKDFSPAL